VDPSAQNNSAIRTASRGGHLSVVERLLQDGRVDPSAQNNSAIELASEYGHMSVVERLLQDERVIPTLSAMGAARSRGHDQIEERLIQVRVRLSSTVNHSAR